MRVFTNDKKKKSETYVCLYRYCCQLEELSFNSFFDSTKE